MPDSFRALYEELMDDTEDDGVFDRVLVPWLQRAEALTSSLASFKRMPEAPNKEQVIDGLWELYALSRISDYLLLPFQEPARPGETEQAVPAIRVDQYVAFFERIGMSVFEPKRREAFHPFWHEVAGVVAAHPMVGPTVHLTAWPGLRFGEMTFSRAGVVVSSGREHIQKTVAESSTLYFAHRRRRRPTADCSIGWGSNSRWRTEIRRDYEHDGWLVYNYDGESPLRPDRKGKDRDGLTFDERLELCRNRCFIRTLKGHGNLWPYDDRFQELAFKTDLAG